MDMIPSICYKDIVAQALKEDIGQGDITTRLVVDPIRQGQAKIVAKEEGVLAGLFVAQEAFLQVDPNILFLVEMTEGARFGPGTEILRLEGSLASILVAERVALNFLQRLCGIATLTNRFVQELQGINCRIVDTRKMTPGLRVLEKYAVRVGGGFNHRFNLSDGILIKDNHIVACGSITKAVQRVKMEACHCLKVEVEVTNLEELKEAIDAGADAVLLDNMSLDQLRQAVDLARIMAPDLIIEASGGITLENVREFAKTGVDLISSGSITHSYKSIDLSLKLHILD